MEPVPPMLKLIEPSKLMMELGVEHFVLGEDMITNTMLGLGGPRLTMLASWGFTHTTSSLQELGLATLIVERFQIPTLGLEGME